MLKILIADDHSIVRKGLIWLLQEEFSPVDIQEAVTGKEAIEKISRSKEWDLIILDIFMPGGNGIETLKQLRADGVKAPILIVSMQPETEFAIRVLKAGASGFINKESATDELITAVHKVISGEKYFSAAVTEKVAASKYQHKSRSGHEILSDREMQVLQLIAKGKMVSEIADEISLSVNTISTYRSRILEKLSLNTNGELTRYAMDNGLI